MSSVQLQKLWFLIPCIYQSFVPAKTTVFFFFLQCFPWRHLPPKTGASFQAETRRVRQALWFAQQEVTIYICFANWFLRQYPLQLQPHFFPGGGTSLFGSNPTKLWYAKHPPPLILIV